MEEVDPQYEELEVDPQYEEWLGSFTDLERKQMFEQEPKPLTGCNHFEYLFIHRESEKAIFFMTYRGIPVDKGFWCPKAAIVQNDGFVVYVADWCKIKEIPFT